MAKLFTLHANAPEQSTQKTLPVCIKNFLKICKFWYFFYNIFHTIESNNNTPRTVFAKKLQMFEWVPNAALGIVLQRYSLSVELKDGELQL